VSRRIGDGSDSSSRSSGGRVDRHGCIISCGGSNGSGSSSSDVVGCCGSSGGGDDGLLNDDGVGSRSL
jgi:hypothetical protein